jgi:hypothetical protein
VKRTVERVIIVVSSLGALYEKVFSVTKEMRRYGKDRDKDKHAAAILSKQ